MLTQVPAVFDVTFPPLVREVLSWFEFINLPVVEMLRPECWSAAGGGGGGGVASQSSVWKLLLPVILPCLWGLMVAIMLWHIWVERRRSPRTAASATTPPGVGRRGGAYQPAPRAVPPACVIAAPAGTTSPTRAGPHRRVCTAAVAVHVRERRWQARHGTRSSRHRRSAWRWPSGATTASSPCRAAYHTAVVLDDGTLYTFGVATWSLGHGDTQEQASPKRVEVEAWQGRHVTSVACGDITRPWSGRRHTVHVRCGNYGRLGHGDRQQQASPSAWRWRRGQGRTSRRSRAV